MLKVWEKTNWKETKITKKSENERTLEIHAKRIKSIGDVASPHPVHFMRGHLGFCFAAWSAIRAIVSHADLPGDMEPRGKKSAIAVGG
jgi:hypothetical protein